jgi:SPX domain protein involved in polyphosphate accumulation
MHAWRRWYRDPTLPVPRTEITRFPHGVLEVKLSLPEGQSAPEWVQDLLDSGYLTEVGRSRPARLPKQPLEELR